MLVDVAVPVPGLEPLTYRAPEGTVPVAGLRAAVPVGRRVLTGVIVRAGGSASSRVRKLKSVVKILDEVPALPGELLELGRWIGEYYQCSWGEALAAMLPAWYRPAGRVLLGLKTADVPDAADDPLTRRVLERFSRGPLTRRQAVQGLPAAAKTALDALQAAGRIIQEVKLPQRRAPAAATAPGLAPTPGFTLTPAQAAALREIEQALDRGKYAALLLHGVTGSGKTEVYLRAMAHALAQGRGAILLVPEISLTPQACRRVGERFGPRVAVLHSRLSAGQRAQAWARLRSGEAAIALGARSAVFAPVRALGLIVVDEEPEGTYKQEDVPRYHARDVAALRARNQDAVLVMGSATPSLESYSNALHGRYRLLTLPERVDGKQLPEVRLVDLSRELGPDGRLPLISRDLSAEIAARLERSEQAILFLNRRGYAVVVLCPACRHVVTCPDCSTAMVYHQQGDVLRCHTCGRSLPARPACPRCGTACVRLAGAGTQRVQEELAREYPGARILRLDLDTTRRQGNLERTLDQFARREADILIGTQMVAKGMDFPGVSLVGIISADTGLHFPDFRAEERTFQLLVQVAGRAGRGGQPGRVLVQTLYPQHPVIQLAQRHDYAGFYQRELAQRRDLQYPPFSRLARILLRGPQAARVRRAAEAAAARLRKASGPQDRILGPAPAPKERVARELRYSILLKCASVASRRRLLGALSGLTVPPGVKQVVDVDPQELG